MSVRQLLGDVSLTFPTGQRTQIVTLEQAATRRPFSQAFGAQIAPHDAI